MPNNSQLVKGTIQPPKSIEEAVKRDVMETVFCNAGLRSIYQTIESEPKSWVHKLLALFTRICSKKFELGESTNKTPTSENRYYLYEGADVAATFGQAAAANAARGAVNAAAANPSMWDSIANGASNLASGAAKYIGQGASWVGDRISGGAKYVDELTGNRLSGAYNAAIDFAGEKWDQATDLAAEQWDKFIDIAGEPVRKFFLGLVQWGKEHGIPGSEWLEKNEIFRWFIDGLADGDGIQWAILLTTVAAATYGTYRICKCVAGGGKLKWAESAIIRIPFFIYNINDSKVVFQSKNLSNIDMYEQYLSYLKSDKESFIDVLKNNNKDITQFTLLFGNYNIIGYASKKSGNIMNIIVDDNIKYSPLDIMKILMLTLKCNVRSIPNRKHSVYVVKVNRKIDPNAFFNLIDDPNNAIYQNFCKNVGGINIEDGLFGFESTLTTPKFYKKAKLNNILGLPDKQFEHNQTDVAILYDGSNKKFKVEETKIFGIIPSNLFGSKTYDAMQAIPSDAYDDIAIKMGIGAAIGTAAGAAAGAIMDSGILKQWAEEFCNLHPVVGTILRPIINNPKTSGAIIGTLLSGGFKPLANKLMDFFRQKKAQLSSNN